MKKIIYVLVGISVIGCVTYVLTQKETAQSIKIGGISALTGVGDAIGIEEHKGALLAVEEINAGGGVAGHSLELVAEDLSLDKIKNAGSVAHKLVNVDKVVAIVGPQWDELAFPILPIIEQAKVPTVGADSSPMLQKPAVHDYFFSTWYDNRVGIREILRFAQKKNIHTIAIIKPISAGFWEYTASIMKSEAAKYGVVITDEVSLGDPLSTDFKTYILEVNQNHPDAIFAVTSDYNQCAFLKQADQVGFRGITFGTESSGDPVSIAQCPTLLENRYFSTPIGSDLYAGFAERFKRRFGSEPRFPSAATSYDAVMAVAHALESTGLEGGEDLRDALRRTSSEGVSVKQISFDEIGFVKTPEDTYVMQTVRGGKFVKAN